MENKVKWEHLVLLGMIFSIVIWSAIKPYGYFEWFFLGSVSFIYIIIFTTTYRKFHFTTFTYVAVFIQAALLLIGAKYTCTYNPVFASLSDTFDFSRNHYDRLEHFFQGFTPFFIVKEIMLRFNYMKRSKGFYFVIVCIILGASAFYELLEFLMCYLSEYTSDYILAHQGDLFDTQWDMTMALIGALVALVFFNYFHNKAMDKLEKEQKLES